MKQKFACQNGATLDVDWRDNVSFASCSTDNNIYVCKLGEVLGRRYGILYPSFRDQSFRHSPPLSYCISTRFW